jgi:hypothetical protein
MRKLKGSHIKWWHVLGTYLNILKFVTKPKPLGKMFQHDFQFFVFANLLTFFSEKTSDQIFLFHNFISHLCKISNQKKKKTDYEMCIWIFSITLSHFERITWIFVYDECHNHFWKKIVSYSVLWIMNWWQSHFGLGAHLRRWQRKQNIKRWMWIFLQPN